MIKLSVVIPIYNEEDNIVPLCEELLPVMGRLNFPYEVIMVDDGSIDRSYDQMLKMREKYPEIKVIKLSENCGKTAAVWTGIRHTRGNTIILLDGDLQNDPNDIPAMLHLMNDYDMVCGWRKNRRDGLWKRFQSRFANWLRNLVLQDDIKDIGCNPKIFKKPRSDALPLLDGLQRFIPVLLQREGYSIIQVPVNHRPRLKGLTKYGFKNRIVRSFLDMLAVKWILNRHIDIKVNRYDD